MAAAVAQTIHDVAKRDHRQAQGPEGKRETGARSADERDGDAEEGQAYDRLGQPHSQGGAEDEKRGHEGRCGRPSRNAGSDDRGERQEQAHNHRAAYPRPRRAAKHDLPPLVPVPPVADLPASELLQAMGRDKKVIAGTLHFVLPSSIGSTQVATDITPAEITEALIRIGIRG